ncbi:MULTISPECIES: PrgI family protein [unclassified Crossiella]|uniref:PrgI family protein n=1 Tax=unclassified Crossiella TaxID=2620835 RepID=UPI0020000842|nr:MULTISPECIES: PrgI family protein [unclassified Crossiella]MCK2239779.1 PrgI family protein [Crossiella sp. S99.2]MCK2252474.1 PrgI family protein [Crossiella sp. S99.1]
MTAPIRISADVDRPDRILGPFTGRQVLILATVGALLYAGYLLTRAFLPLLVFALAALPIAALAVALALGQRDGISLDRLALAALRQALRPRHRVAAPEGIPAVPAWLAQHATHSTSTQGVSPAPLELPVQAVTDTGVIDLGADGLAVLAVCSTVNFALRTAAEQQALVAVFARFLNSLTAPVQLLVRAQRLDLSTQIAELQTAAPRLPHPALEQAACEHADYLTQLARTTDLLRRQVLLVLREPLHRGTTPGRSLLARFGRAQGGQDEGARRAAEMRLVQRIQEAAALLAPAGITVAPLEPGATASVLAGVCDPDSLIPPGTVLAAADEVIITAPADGWNPAAFGTPPHTEDTGGDRR